MILKAMLFFMLVTHSAGEVKYAHGVPIDSCKAEVIEKVVGELKAQGVPKELAFHYICLEPGATPIKASNE